MKNLLIFNSTYVVKMLRGYKNTPFEHAFGQYGLQLVVRYFIMTQGEVSRTQLLLVAEAAGYSKQIMASAICVALKKGNISRKNPQCSRPARYTASPLFLQPGTVLIYKRSLQTTPQMYYVPVALSVP